MTAPLRLAVLISGNGSNLQAIIDAIEADEINAEIKAVISNDRSAFGLVRATQHGLHTWVLDHRDYADRAQFDDVLRHYLQTIDPDFIVLAGFMRILGERFVETFGGRRIGACHGPHQRFQFHQYRSHPHLHLTRCSD